MKEKVSKLVNVYKKYGFIGFCKKLYAYIEPQLILVQDIKNFFNETIGVKIEENDDKTTNVEETLNKLDNIVTDSKMPLEVTLKTLTYYYNNNYNKL